MAGGIKGITIEIGGNTAPLDKALKDVNKTTRDLQSELREVNKQLKLDPGNTILLEQKQKLLAESVTNTKNKLETLKDAEKQVQEQFAKGKVSEEQFRALQREVIKTESNLKSLESQALKANAILSKDEAIGNLKNIGKTVAVAGAAATAAFVGMGVSVLNNADELQRQADVTGLSAERLQELQYAGNNLGVELDTLTGSQAKLTKSMSSASEGNQKWQESVDKTTKEITELVKSGASADDIFKRLSKSGTLSDAWKPDEIKKFSQELKKGKVSADDLWAALAEGTELVDKNSHAFGLLGVNITDGNGKLRDNKVVMMEVIDALGKVENETERDALSMQIFGKSAMELNPMIKAGGAELNKLSEEAKKNGAVMSNEAVAGLDSFGDTMDNIKSSIMGAFGEKLVGLLPTIQILIDKLMNLPQWIKKNATLLEIIGVVILTVTALIIAFNIQQALLASGMTLWEAIAAGATIVTTGLGVAFTFLTSPIGLIILAIGALIIIGILLYKNWDKVKEVTINVWNSIKEFFVNLWVWIKSFFITWGPLILTMLFPFLGIPLQIIKHWDSIKAFFINMKDSVKSALHDMFNFQIPHFKLPHFSIKGSFSLSPPSIPSLGVDWYDKGGIFSSPQVIGVGEKRPEFVGALDDLRYLIRDEFDKKNNNTAEKYNLVNVYIGNEKIMSYIDNKQGENLGFGQRGMA